MRPVLQKLVAFIRENAPVSATLVSEHFETSRRTIRTYVKQANDALAGVAVITSARNGGYRIDIFDEQALTRCLRSEDTSFQGLPQTAEERCAYLLNDLLSRDEWVTIEDLAATLFVSPRTVSRDLNEVERQLDEVGLTLEKRPHYGIRVAGSELARRLCLASAATQESLERQLSVSPRRPESSLVAPASSEAAALFSGTRRLASIARIVDETIDRTGTIINPLFHRNLLVHIAIALARMQSGSYVPIAIEDIDAIAQRSEFAVAVEIAHGLEGAFQVEFPVEEVCYIALHLAAKQELSPDSGENASGVESSISDEVWGVVARMIDTVEQDFHFELRHDLELRMNLARHITPLLTRLKYAMKLKNPILTDIKARFPLAWFMAFDAAAVLADSYHAEVSDDEIGYIALSFALALERRKSGPARKRVLVICATGAGTARLLEWSIRQEFPRFLGEVRVCDLAHAEEAARQGIDYIFTTVPLPWPSPVPVCQISAIFSESDRRRILAVLEGELHPSQAEQRFHPELFCGCMGERTPKAVIHRLCAIASSQIDLPTAFERLVLERECLMCTAMGGAVAMPHPVRAVTSDTFVCVGILDEPIPWGERKVQAVFLVSVSTRGTDEPGLREFYEVFSRFLVNSRAIHELIDDPRYEKLIELIRKETTQG